VIAVRRSATGFGRTAPTGSKRNHQHPWLLDHLGLTNLAELEDFLNEPLTPAMERFLETRERILMRRNLAKLIQEAIEAERVDRVIAAVLGGGSSLD
jgi:hypothetical protein